MNDTMDIEATEYKIKALQRARNDLELEVKTVQNEPQKPWREGESIDYVSAAKKALRDIQDQIIELELSLRDPIQEAEMRAELHIEMSLSGCRDDIDLYMHTPEQERMFQQEIRDQVDHGYYNEYGDWEDGLDSGRWDSYGPCDTCKNPTDYEESIYIEGDLVCDYCGPDALGFFFLLCIVTGRGYRSNKWETEFNFVTDDDEL